MTYNVFGGTLNLCSTIQPSFLLPSVCWKTLLFPPLDDILRYFPDICALIFDRSVDW